MLKKKLLFTVGICTQILTSIDALETITDTTSHSYDWETTPVKKAFFYLPEDLAGSKTAKAAHEEIQSMCGH